MALKRLLTLFTAALAFVQFSSVALAQTYYSVRYREHATDCTSLTDGKDKDFCWELDSNRLFKCEPSVGNCDTVGEWKEVAIPFTQLIGAATDGQIPDNITIDLAATATALAANGSNCSPGNFPLGVGINGESESCTDVILPSEIDTLAKLNAILTDATLYTGPHTTDTTLNLAGVETITGNWVNTANPWADNEVADNITASNYLPLAGGTLTGNVIFSNLGLELTDSDTNPTCSAGEYKIFADLSENKLKKCMNGSVTDLDTTGGTPSFATLSGGTNTSAAMLVGTGASLAPTGSGTVTATDLTAGSSVVSDAEVDNDITITTVNASTETAFEAALDLQDIAGAVTDGQVPDTITASNYLPLSGGTLTGALITDNLGIEFAESDTNPTCGAGDYHIFADLSELKLKKCTNGSVTDLDTTGGTPSFGTITGGTNTAAAMLVGTGASLGPTGSGTVTANALTASSLTSAQLLAALTDETGTGAAVFATSPTLVTPILGVASATSVVGSITLAGNPALAANTVSPGANGLIFEGTTNDAFEGLLKWDITTVDKTLTLPNATDTLVGKATTDTFTNKSISLTSNTLTATSAQMITALSDETGTGAMVFAGGNIGAATATTAATDDNDTSVATTAFVQGEISQMGGTGLTVTSGVLDCDAASSTSSGCSELATVAEIDTATDTGRTLTPDALNDSDYGAKNAGILMHDYTTTVTTGTAGFLSVPATLDTWELKDVICCNQTPGTTGSTDITIWRNRSGTQVEMLSTDVMIASGDYCASDEVINTSNDDISEGDILLPEVTGLTTTPPSGMSCTLTFRRP